MRSHRLLLLTASILVVASLIPASSAAVGITNPNVPTGTTLYFHIMDAQNDIPINTQKPSDLWELNARVGLQTHSTCVQDPPNPLLNKEYHTLFGYSSPSYVEYAFLDQGKPRLHPERGLSFNVQLVDGYTPTLTWFLETGFGLNVNEPADPDTLPIVLRDVVVRAHMRESDKISVGDAAYREGNIIMSGQSAPATLAPDETGLTEGAKAHKLPNGHNVYEFNVPLEIESPVIPRETGYNFEVEIFMQNPYCDEEGDYLMPNVVNHHSSPDFRPNIDLQIMNAIRIEYLHPQFVGEDMVIHSSLNSPWGNYDVDEQSVYNGDRPDGIKIQILDAAGNQAAPSLAPAAFVQRFHEHDHHQEAVDATYIWPYKQDRAPNGLYTVKMEVWNDQRTAMAAGSAEFELGKGIVNACGDSSIGQDGVSSNDDCFTDVQRDGKTQSQGSPGIGMVAILGVLAAAVMVLRRRL